MTSKVSFTVRRPTPVSRDTSTGPESDGGNFKKPALPRHLAGDSSAPGSPLARSATSSPTPKDKPVSFYNGQVDSSDEEDDEQDELVTGFDRFGVERKDNYKKSRGPQGPLIIPALRNRDWREVARKRKTVGQFVPEAGKAQTGADGSVGGLGTHEIINAGPELSGLQVRQRTAVVESDEDTTTETTTDVSMAPPEPESEDQAALRAILADASGQSNGTIADILPAPISEKDALNQDVNELPESASLDDYARVPVEQFGAALLRGMGWKEGMAASRKSGKGMVEPYIPEARPALLGIGAKEREPLDDGSKKKKGRPDKKYVPLVKQERAGGESSSGDRERDRDRDRDRRRERSRSPRRESHSRRSSRSPGRRREYDYEDDRRSSSYRKEDRDRQRDRDRDRDRERTREYSHKDGRRDRSRERSSKRERY